jgi:hypothetical protein
MSPGFPLNFGRDYGSLTVIVFTALAWPLLLSRFSVWYAEQFPNSILAPINSVRPHLSFNQRD